MSVASPIKVQEVRSGLFRIHWIFNEAMKRELGEYTEVFQLLGTQSHRIYTITFQLKNPNENDFKQGYRYEYSVTVAETKSESQSKINALSIISNSKVHQHEEVNPKVLDCAYMFIDNKYASGLEIPLKKMNGTKWAMTCVHPTIRENLTLWMDFGTHEHLSENVMDVINGLDEMFHKQNLCDVQFQFSDGQTIGAHINILSARSPVFSAMFQSGMMETQNREISIVDIEPEVFRQLLIHLYTGKAPKLEVESITPLLLEAAEKYNVEMLKNQCVDVLLKRVRRDNAIKLLIWSHFHSIPSLYHSSMNCVVDNWRELCSKQEWMDFMKNHPELCVLAIQRMASRP
jgi:hypothetical protein